MHEECKHFFTLFFFLYILGYTNIYNVYESYYIWRYLYYNMAYNPSNTINPSIAQQINIYTRNAYMDFIILAIAYCIIIFEKKPQTAHHHRIYDAWFV